MSHESAEEPLLSRQNSNRHRRRSSLGLPGSHMGHPSEHRRSSAASRRARESFQRRESLAHVVEEEPGMRGWVKNTVSILAVCAVGTAGWVIAWRTGVWTPAPPEDQEGSTNMALGAQILGYISAVCYLGARIPQIIKNQRDRSCEGLSLLFFLLSLLGNLTYGAGVSRSRPIGTALQR
jgi:solute carrier family 66 (lysosomal lysine-arginine transporter), member 1